MHLKKNFVSILYKLTFKAKMAFYFSLYPFSGSSSQDIHSICTRTRKKEKKEKKVINESSINC